MPEFPSFANLENIRLIEEQYARYLADPESVDASWRSFFAGVDFGSYLAHSKGSPVDGRSLKEFAIVQAYRRYGHLAARINPLQDPPSQIPELTLDTKEFSELLATYQAIYANRIGFEYMDLGNPELEKWIQARIEPKLNLEPSAEDKRFLLEMLSKAEIFETFMHTRYVGQTRFSLEGAESLIPLVAAMLTRGGEMGLEDCTIGIAHRGRLNVLANILNKPYSVIFQEFEDDTTLSMVGNDDVRYHLGFTGEYGKVAVSMTPNPSHLESVDPVTVGQVRAKQVQHQDAKRSRFGALLIHGDAALAGQGVVYETLQMMRLDGYSIGGTIHIAINNQIGFTTDIQDSRSTRYCTDIAKAFGCPVFHVNAEDPESCLFVAKLAAEIRQTFQCDVFIDLLCYRKYGHNEGDEPSFTQPLEYKTIRSKKSIRQLFAEKFEGAETIESEFKEMLKKALSQAQPAPAIKTLTLEKDLLAPFPTNVAQILLKQVLDTFATVPADFHLHTKLQKWLQDRKNAARVDWATAECLALGTLLSQGIAVRLAGEDVQRGTFSQRHLVWIDSETGKPHNPLSELKARFDVVNSLLSEFAALGFEYGYSTAWPEAFVLWEAQYGDFFNGAQIVIDQYIASAEQKWDVASSLTLLLPHAYEGAGPEHSSARIERFLQLCANQNLQVTYPSTPAQYFHLLRRQGLRPIKKPLIVFTPKSLLRAPANTSPWKELEEGRFEEILDDTISAKKALFCTGKIYYELLAQREANKKTDIAIVRIEQLYPLHKEKLQNLLSKYTSGIAWVQEEPENMGAWRFIKDYLPGARYVGRPANATPATGSHKKHKQEQQELLAQAMSVL